MKHSCYGGIVVPAQNHVPAGGAIIGVFLGATGRSPLSFGPWHVGKFLCLGVYDRAVDLDAETRRRRSIRLREYDYTQAGAYFITLVAQGRAMLFGEIAGGETRLNEFGRIVDRVWCDLPNHYAAVQCDAFVIMPNHIHGIIILKESDVRAGFKPALHISIVEPRAV